MADVQHLAQALDADGAFALLQLRENVDVASDIDGIEGVDGRRAVETHHEAILQTHGQGARGVLASHLEFRYGDARGGWVGVWADGNRGSGGPRPSPLAGGGPTGVVGGAPVFGAGEGPGGGAGAGFGSGVFPAGATGSPAPGAEPVLAAPGFLPVGADRLSGWVLDCASAAWAQSEARSRGRTVWSCARGNPSLSHSARAVSGSGRRGLVPHSFSSNFFFMRLRSASKDSLLMILLNSAR